MYFDALQDITVCGFGLKSLKYRPILFDMLEKAKKPLKMNLGIDTLIWFFR